MYILRNNYFPISNTQTKAFRIALRKVYQYTGIKWLIRGPDHHKVNQLHSLEHPAGCFATLDFSFLMKYFSNDLNRYNDGGMQTFLV